MNNYLELAQLSDGTIVLRRSDDKENPLVKIKFSGEVKAATSRTRTSHC